MKIMIKKFDSTKVQYDFIEFDTETFEFGLGNSGIKETILKHDMVITVTTNKEFAKQFDSVRKYYMSETL